VRFRHLRRPVLVAATAVLSAAGVVATALIVPSAMATDVDDAQRKVDQLSLDVTTANEQYNFLQAQIPPMQQQLELATARQADQQRYIDTLKGQMTALAVAAYKGGGVDPSLSVFLSEDPVALVQNGAVVEALSRSRVAGLDDYANALTQLDADRAASEAKLAEIQALEAQSATIKADTEAQLAGAQDILAQAERGAAERAAAALAASRARAATTPAAGGGGAAPVVADGGGGPVAPGTSCADVGVSAPNGRVAAVLEFACAQLGKPYQWAADGPGSYDCSGFTMSSWAQGGVSLPHSSRLQYANGAKVDRASLQPGDLVFFYSPISHVGIYLGNGYMIAAPSSGDVVKVQKMYSPYTGAIRP